MRYWKRFRRCVCLVAGVCWRPMCEAITCTRWWKQRFRRSESWAISKLTPADSSHDAHTPPESLPVPHRDGSLVQVIGNLIHQFRLDSGARGIYFQDRGSRGIVPTVDGAGFATVQVASVASKGDQVNHGI